MRTLILTLLTLLCTYTGSSAQTVLVSEPDSTRAVALESPTFKREPFSPTSVWSFDRRSRITFFVMNLSLQAGDDLSAIRVMAEDISHRQYEMRVEYLGKVVGFEWMSQIVVRLPDELGDVGDVLVGITYRGTASNRVRAGIGYVGGGLPDDPGARPTPGGSYMVKGRIAGLNGVTLILSGSQLLTTTSDASGNYTFANLAAGGNYTVTPSLINYNFTPPNAMFNDLNANQAANFTGTLNTHGIGGRITDGKNTSLAGVTVTLSGGQGATTATDANGNYAFANLPAGANYTVTPQLTNYAFTPLGVTFTNLSVTGTANFNGTLGAHTISGRVTDTASNSLPNVTVMLSGAQTGTALTDAGGNYSFSVAAGGNYMVTPTLTNYTFAPPNRTFNNLSGNQTANFTATLNTFTLSGQVVEGANGLRGVTVTLSGSQTTATTTTDAGGNYAFAGVAAGNNYAVTPSLTHYTFAPSSQTFNNLAANQTANFTATLNKHIIGGRIADGANNSLAGVTLTLSGSQSGTTITDAGGNYAFANLPAAGNYIVSPARTNYTFSPASLAFNTLSANQTANFTGTLNTFTLSGHIQDAVNTNLGSVTITLSGSQSAMTATDANGNYTFANLPAGGNYTLTPTLTNYTFAPPNRTFNNLSGNQTANFTATLNTFTLSGQVLEGANGLRGVTVTLSGSQSLTTTSDASGNYTFANLAAGGSYTVTPSLVNYIFAPPSQTFNNLSANQRGNFTATLNTHSIGGRIAEGSNNSLAGVTITLSGSQNATTATDANGNYAFANLPAGGNYTLTPTLAHYTFTPANGVFNNLSANGTANFVATRNRHAISGQIKDGNNNALLSGVTVTLSGGQSATTTSDANGNYAFANLPAGVNYAVTPAHMNYTFAPPSRTVNNLSENQAALNFTGTVKTVTISGRVTEGGTALFAATVTLSGSQSATTTTDSNGYYTLPVNSLGEYTITPAKQFYTFTPASQTFNYLAGDRSANFTAALTINSPAYVLEFDGSPMTVDHGLFWPENVDLGHFFWEFWAMPGNDNYTRYLLSDGYGGFHALLFGFNYGTDGRYSLYGNVWRGSGWVETFRSDEGPAVNEWGHLAVGWDGQNIITYFNGVPVGKRAFAGPRRTPGRTGGGGAVLIGGSDHNNFRGRMAQVRGYENSNPRASSPESSFAPQTVFKADGNFLSYHFLPTGRVSDLSFGYNQSLHPGNLRGVIYGMLNDCSDCPLPKFILDPTAPDFSKPDNPGQITAPVDSPPNAPVGALVFDSFSRRNSTYILGGTGGLGSTEVGSKLWQTSPSLPVGQAFGILNGRAVLLANQTSLAWVALESTDLDIRVDRHPGLYGTGLSTGLSFRVLNKDNYFFAYAESEQLNVGYYLNGQRVDLVSGFKMPEGWITLRVVTNATGAIRIYHDSGLLYSTSSTVLSNAAGAGLYNHAKGMGLSNRWDKFLVFGAS